MGITHVVYDMDGLLLDTERFYTQVTQTIVGRYGHTFDWSLKSRMIGKKAIDSARILVETLKLPIAPEEYLHEREAYLDVLFPTVEPMPGAMRLTTHLARHGIPQAVATSSRRRDFELKVSRHGEWFACFQSIRVAAERVPHQREIEATALLRLPNMGQLVDEEALWAEWFF